MDLRPMRKTAIPLLFLLLVRVHAESAAWRTQVEEDWLRQYRIATSEQNVAPFNVVGQALDLTERTLAFVGQTGPVAEFATELAALRASRPSERLVTEEDLRRFYLQVRWLRRRVILRHPLLAFDRMLVNKRAPTLYSHQCDQYLGRHSQPGPGLVELSSWRSEAEERQILTGKLPTGAVLHPELSYDAERVIFSFCDHTVEDRNLRRFFIYEAALDGSAVRQLTGTPTDPMEGWEGRATVLIEDFDPCYLPGGDFVFISTRNQGFGRCHGGRYTPSYVLYRARGDGSDIHAISFGEANEWDPAVLHDGRLIYTRWDYINRHDTVFQSLWTTRQDGSATAHFYGNYTRNPCMQAEARPIPGSHKVVCTAMGHHSYTAGSIMVVDPYIGQDGLEPVTRITPEAAFPETEGWPTGCYATPFPLSEELYLTAFCPDRLVGQGGVQRTNAYGIYLVDTLGGRELLYRDPEMSCFSPFPVAARPEPRYVPSMLSTKTVDDSGVFFIQDVYECTEPIERGTIKRVRVNRILSQPTARVPARSCAANEITKGILGTVPVNDDGSVAFRAPAGVPLQLQILDENGMAVMTMRSQVYLQSGEVMSCVGCHEPRDGAPARTLPTAQTVHELEPPAGPRYEGGFSFMRTVQPVLDRYCIRCHGLGEEPGRISLLNTPADGSPGNAAYASLTAGDRIKVAQRNRETAASTPRDYFAHGSKIPALLLGKHKERVGLDRGSFQRIVDWLDLNAQCYGDYSHNRAESRSLSADAERKLRAHLRETFGAEIANQPIGALINQAMPSESRILKAPLALAAGGWGQIEPAWENTDDPGCVRMSQLVTECLGDVGNDVDGTCGRENCCCGSCWVRRAREASRLLRSLGSDADAWVAELRQASPVRRLELLRLLAEHTWYPAFPAALDSLDDPDVAIRAAAIEAVARLGRGKALPALLGFLTKGEKGEREAALRALATTPGDGISRAIAAAIPDNAPRTRVTLLELLAKRQATAEVAAVQRAARDSDTAVRLAAIGALGQLAGADHVADLLDLVVGTPAEAERKAATDAALEACSRLRDGAPVADTVDRLLPGAPDAVRRCLLQVLGVAGGTRALDLVRTHLSDPDAATRSAAIRALGRWRTSHAMPVLLDLAKNARGTDEKTLALTGYLDLARRDETADIATRLKRLDMALGVTDDDVVKKQILLDLGRVPDPSALETAGRYVNDPAVSDAAESAVVEVAGSIHGSHWQQAEKALRKLLGYSLNADLRARARETIELIQVTHPPEAPALGMGLDDDGDILDSVLEGDGDIDDLLNGGLEL